MRPNISKSVICAALLLSGVNLVPAAVVLTTLVGNASQPMQDDFYLGSTFVQPFTTGGAASLNMLFISSNSGWSASDSPTVALLDSGRNLVASFVYSASYREVVTYSVSSYALQAASTYFIEISGGNGYLNVTDSPIQTGLPGWTIGDLSYRGIDSSASTPTSQILQFSLSGQVPEPATSSLLAIGLGLFALARRRSRA
jgi:hypothetical protein